MSGKRLNFTKKYLYEEYVINRKSLRTICKENSCDKSTVSYWLEKFDIELKLPQQKIGLNNQKFGSLIVIGPDEENPPKWLCLCECGNIISLLGSRVKKKISCRECSAKRAGKLNFRGCGELSGNIWSSIRCRATSKNLEFSITVEYAWELFLKQDRKCALSGVDIKLSSKRNGEGGVEQTASLDRIDSSKGYTPDNVQWVHKRVNVMKNNMTDDELLDYCIKIVQSNIDKVKNKYNIDIISI